MEYCVFVRDAVIRNEANIDSFCHLGFSQIKYLKKWAPLFQAFVLLFGTIKRS
jgi:hypothetical protein